IAGEPLDAIQQGNLCREPGVVAEQGCACLAKIELGSEQHGDETGTALKSQLAELHRITITFAVWRIGDDGRTGHKRGLAVVKEIKLEAVMTVVCFYVASEDFRAVSKQHIGNLVIARSRLPHRHAINREMTEQYF